MKIKIFEMSKTRAQSAEEFLKVTSQVHLLLWYSTLCYSTHNGQKGNNGKSEEQFSKDTVTVLPIIITHL